MGYSGDPVQMGDVTQRLGLGRILWIRLEQDEVRWQTLVNTVMNLRFHTRREII
jgi:hypothetical protein